MFSHRDDLHISLREHHIAINRAHQSRSWEHKNGIILGSPSGQYNLKPNEIEYLIKMLGEDGMQLKECHVQTPKMCLTAVEQNGLALEHVWIRKSRRICIAAVKQNPDALQFVDDITDEIRMIARGVRICPFDEHESDISDWGPMMEFTGDEPVDDTINTSHMMVMTGM